MLIKNNYIPQIDGLRAIAVLSVILFHADFQILNISFLGGYFGVDIFFVISGYLITKLIITEIKNENNFNFKNFYLRRIKRLLPALLTVAIFSYIFAWLFLWPISFLEYIGSLVSGIFFSSNIFFYFTEIQYNASQSIYKPLLHYWSLSVEEQFYLLYPVSLFAIYKYFKKNLVLSFIIISIISFILSIYLSLHNPSLSFYLLPTRIWELLVGAYAAKLHIENTRFLNNNSSSFSIQLVGLFLIVVSILLVKNSTGSMSLQEYEIWTNNMNIKNTFLYSHPGVITLLPVVGTFLIILFSNDKNIINKFLSYKPIVFTGLISYSLYLWHFPIFSFIRLSQVSIDTPFKYIVLIFLILTLSILSYYLIEKPFRNKKASLKKLSLYCGSIIIILLFLSFNAIKNDGYVNSMPDILNGLRVVDKEGKFLSKKKIEIDRKDEAYLRRRAVLNPTFKNILLIGDSHAADFASDRHFEELLIEREKNLLFQSYTNIFSLDLINVETNVSLINEYDKVSLNEELNKILKKKKISTIILIARFPLYLNRTGFDAQQGRDSIEYIPGYLTYFLDSNNERLKEKIRIENIEKSFNKGVLELLNKDINVIIFYPIPETGFWVPNVLAGRVLPRHRMKSLLNQTFLESSFLAMPQSSYLTTSYDLYLKRNKDVFKMLDKIQHPNLFRVYIHKKLCNSQIKNRCMTHTDKEVYYRDNNHLSKMGRKLIIPELLSVIDQIN